MKIAIAADDGRVARHFGHCQQYALFQVEKGQIKGREDIENPGHQPNYLPRFLAQQGVNCIIAGGMGHRAMALFKEAGIESIIGIEGLVEGVMDNFLKGELTTGDNACHH